MKKERIYFTLDKKPPHRMSAEYNGRRADIYLGIVPAVMESKKPLLFEEEVKLAENYLKVILNYPSI